ncbi:MAG: hypothetical protein ACOC5K_00175 [Chloroflexota bacterium]
MRLRPGLFIFLASFAALAAMVAGCTEQAGTSPTPEPTPTATPTPEPTATPTASPVAGPDGEFRIITADPSQDREAFEAALPSGELECLRSGLDDAAYESLYSREHGLTEEQEEQILSCFSSQTLAGVVVGQIVAESGLDLSEETRSCMAREADDIELGPLIASSLGSTSGDGGSFDLSGTFAAMDLIFCMDEDERAQLEDSLLDGGGDTGFGLSVDILECLVDRVGGAELAEMLESAQQGLPSAAFELLPAFLACGGELPTSPTPGTDGATDDDRASVPDLTT